MKFKFNFKLTAFLVSLFTSLLLVVLGSKNMYCLSFGFVLMGSSLMLFVLYSNEKMQNGIAELEKEIDKVEANIQEESELNENDETGEENAYILKQLYIAQDKMRKKKHQASILFNLCGIALIFVGLISLF